MKKVLFNLATLVLIVTAVLKVLTLTSSNRLLSELDPVFNLSTRFVLFIAAISEFLVAFVLLKSAISQSRKVIALSCLVMLFALYRFGIYIINPSKKCNCLGIVQELFGVSSVNAEQLANFAFGILLAITLVLAFAKIHDALRYKKSP